MSFDVYFFDLAAGESFQDAMGRSEQAADDDAELGPADLARWESVVSALRPLVPGAEEFAATTHRELNDDATGMQVSLDPGGLSVTVAYWHSGPEALDVVDRLRAVTSAIEAATGLTAYDPQADAAFLGAGEHTAASTFDRVDTAMSDHSGPHRPAGEGGAPQRRRFFRRNR